jgi:hypothetical protein
VPFSQKLVAQNAQSPKKVAQCQPIVGAPTANSTKSAAAAAPLPAVNAPLAAAAANANATQAAAAAGGRRLQQAAAPLAQGPVPVALAPVRSPACCMRVPLPSFPKHACIYVWSRV